MKVELLCSCEKEELEKRIQKVAAAGKLSRFKGNVFEVLENCNDYEKNLKLIKRIISMGHKSIIEHDYLVFAISDVTPIIEQTIIGNRLTSFTIKSRREVDFRTAGFYTPEFRDSNGAKEIKPGESQIIGKIKLKVKDSVAGTTTKVLLSDIEVFGPETTGDTTTDTPKGDAISDASISLTIKEPTKDGTPIVSDIPKSEVKQNKNKNANIASNEVPYTGIEDTIPVIFILAIISVLAYINYKKYKNI